MKMMETIKKFTVKKIMLCIIFIIYLLFIVFQLNVVKDHHEGSTYEIVASHLSDYTISAIEIKPGENVFIKKLKSLNNIIAIDLNQNILGKKLFGIFDMRITKHVLIMWVVVIMCILIFIPLANSIKRNKTVSRSRWVNFWEAIIVFIHDDIVKPNFDHKYTKKVTPFFVNMFFFILFCNLLGMVPGLGSVTGNLAITSGLASVTLVGIIVAGIIKQGPLWFYRGLVPRGIPVIIGIFILPIELLGLIIKPFALTVRLFANMTAGHFIIIIFLFLIIMFQSYFISFGSIIGALMIYLLEILVSFIQSYIFTALSAIFIGSSMHRH